MRSLHGQFHQDSIKWSKDDPSSPQIQVFLQERVPREREHTMLIKTTNFAFSRDWVSQKCLEAGFEPLCAKNAFSTFKGFLLLLWDDTQISYSGCFQIPELKGSSGVVEATGKCHYAWLLKDFKRKWHKISTKLCVIRNFYQVFEKHSSTNNKIPNLGQRERWLSAYLLYWKPWVWSFVQHKPGMVAHYTPVTPELGTWESEVQGHPHLHNELTPIWGTWDPVANKQNQMKTNTFSAFIYMKWTQLANISLSWQMLSDCQQLQVYLVYVVTVLRIVVQHRKCTNHWNRHFSALYDMQIIT